MTEPEAPERSRCSTSLNSTVEKDCAELKMADAVPRSFAGNQAATMRALAGNEGASVSPTSSRMENSMTTAVPAVAVKKLMPPCSTVNSDQTKMLTAYTRLEPKRSSSQPPGSCAST